MRKPSVVSELRQAERRLVALCAVGDESGCAVEDQHKEAVRLYVQTWITPLVRNAITRLDRKKAKAPVT